MPSNEDTRDWRETPCPYCGQKMEAAPIVHLPACKERKESKLIAEGAGCLESRFVKDRA